MQFKVPQFLDIEDTIFGPFTFKEFVYLVGGGFICFIIYRVVGFLWGFIPMLAVAGLSLALTFYRPNGKPLINMIESGVKYFTQNKLYIWKRRRVLAKNKTSVDTSKETLPKSREDMEQKLTGSKLRDLAWSLDVLDLRKENK